MERVSAPDPSSSRPTVRRMRLSDVADVVAIEAEAFTTPWKASTFQSLMERPAAELWVLDDPEAGVVGYAVVWCILDQGEIANIAVSSTHRGRGLGARLLEEMLEVAGTRGVKTMYLEVRVSNEAARRLYERYGFHRVGTRREYYESPREDALVMVKRL